MVSSHPHQAARAAIQAAGLKQRFVAEHLGIDPSKLSKSLAGVRKFSAGELDRLAELTGVDVECLAMPEPDPVEHPNPRMSGAEFARRKQDILDAAWPLFTARGYQSVTVAEIAAAAGMSQPAVLYYFHSKNDIFIATLDLCATQAAARREFLGEIQDPAERLLRFAEVQLDGSPESKREWTTWAQFWASAPAFSDAQQATAAAYSRWQQGLRGIVEEGIAAGRFYPGEPEPMVNAVTAMIDGFGVRMISGVLSPEQARDAVTAYLRTWVLPEVEEERDS
ncbi:hypothetical protein A0K93_01075 [Corynebacterium sp. BCW_4722]|nr:hypothetical protein A0K93_01075 [Corynebacterium sp. BCW_4722]